MRKCDSCGKVVVNEQDYMCPHCGAVTKKHCDHIKHLPDDKYNRANDYRTASEEHKSKTYDYEKAPKTDVNQKFDINDLANIKNAEDVKKIAKKAFIEQDKNGRKKFKPIAIVFIVIFAVNIFANLADVAFDAVDSVFEEIGSKIPDSFVGYELGEETITHNFTVSPYFKDGSYDKENDCLTLNLSELFFKYTDSINEEWDTIAEEWQSEFTSPQEYFYSERVEINLTVFSQTQLSDAELIENSYRNSVALYGEITSEGTLYIWGLEPHVKDFVGQPVFLDIHDITLKSENADTKERFDYWFSLPFNFIKINPNKSCSFFNIYAHEGEISRYEYNLDDQYYPDEEELEEYVEMVAW